MNTFKKIYYTNDDPTKMDTEDRQEEYLKYRSINDCRVLFELIAGYKRPEYLNVSQFNKLAHFPDMRNEEITKPSYDIIFKKFAKKADGTLLTLDHFFNAIEYLASKLYPENNKT